MKAEEGRHVFYIDDNAMGHMQYNFIPISTALCIFHRGAFFLGDGSLMGRNVLKLHQVEQLWECIMDNVLIIILYHTSNSR